VQSIFLSEAFLLKEELYHPNIVRCDGWFCDEEDSTYVVTERLHERVDEALVREPSLEKLYEVMKEMASALTHIENKGIVHYDVKPGNIMLDGAGDSRLIDFNMFMIKGEKAPKYRGTHGFTPFQHVPYAHPSRDKFGYGMTFTSILLRMNEHSSDETAKLRDHLVIGRPYAFETLAKEGVPDSLISGVLAKCVESVDEQTALAGYDLEEAVMKFGKEQGFESRIADVEEAMVQARAEDREKTARRLRV
jgi:serine/threonine protein kinase